MQTVESEGHSSDTPRGLQAFPWKLRAREHWAENSEWGLSRCSQEHAQQIPGAAGQGVFTRLSSPDSCSTPEGIGKQRGQGMGHRGETTVLSRRTGPPVSAAPPRVPGLSLSGLG